MLKRSFCLKKALSSKPSLASAAMSLPSLVSASGLTYNNTLIKSQAHGQGHVARKKLFKARIAEHRNSWMSCRHSKLTILEGR